VEEIPIIPQTKLQYFTNNFVNPTINFAKEHPRLMGLSLATALGTGYLTQKYISNKISNYKKRKEQQIL
jgi:hypothetical protein